MLVRDAHGTARNIIPRSLPENARIIRGGRGDMFAMVTGIVASFHALLMTGFHSGVGTEGSPISHTKQGVYQALSGDLDTCKITLPEKFVMKMRFCNHADAYFNSFYTGIKQLDAKTLQYETDDYLEILRMVHFVLDK